MSEDSTQAELVVTAIDTAGSFEQLGRGGSTYLLRANSPELQRPFHLLIDAGSQGQIDLHVDSSEIDAIYISHLHPDHMNLAPWIVRHWFAPDGPFHGQRRGQASPATPKDLYGPAGTMVELLRKVNTFGGNPLANAEVLGQLFRFHEISPGEFTIGPLQTKAARTIHPVDTYALRVDFAEASFCYSSDGAANPESGVNEAVLSVAKNATLLLCNAPNEIPDVHQSPTQAGLTARLAGVHQLVISHFTPAWDNPDWAANGRDKGAAEAAWRGLEQVKVAEARREFGSRIEAATPGKQWDIMALAAERLQRRHALRSRPDFGIPQLYEGVPALLMQRTGPAGERIASRRPGERI